MDHQVLERDYLRACHSHPRPPKKPGKWPTQCSSLLAELMSTVTCRAGYKAAYLKTRWKPGLASPSLCRPRTPCLRHTGLQSRGCFLSSPESLPGRCQRSRPAWLQPSSLPWTQLTQQFSQLQCTSSRRKGLSLKLEWDVPADRLGPSLVLVGKQWIAPGLHGVK